MSKNKLGEDSPISKFIHLKIRRRDEFESLTTLEEGEFKVSIGGCINVEVNRPICFQILDKWSRRGLNPGPTAP